MREVERMALGQTYHDTKPVLDKVARQVAHRYGGDLEEMRADACGHMIAAWLEYDGRSPWDYFVKTFVGRRLLMDRRKELRRLALLPRESAAVLETVAEPPIHKFDVCDFCDSLSSDAGEVIRLVFAPANRRKHPVTIRVGIRKELAGRRWSQARIGKAFKEIRRTL